MKTIKILVLLLIIILFSGCSNNPKTLEEVMDNKINNPSEFDKCIQMIKDSEARVKVCITQKLAEKGYNDGIDCISEFNNDVCSKFEIDPETHIQVQTRESMERYNAEVNAINDCNVLEVPKNVPTVFDCSELPQ